MFFFAPCPYRIRRSGDPVERTGGDPGGKIGAMSRRPARCTQADIHRAIKAVEQAGSRMAIEILPDGTIRIASSSAKAAEPTPVAPQRDIVL